MTIENTELNLCLELVNMVTILTSKVYYYVLYKIEL